MLNKVINFLGFFRERKKREFYGVDKRKEWEVCKQTTMVEEDTRKKKSRRITDEGPIFNANSIIFYYRVFN